MLEEWKRHTINQANIQGIEMKITKDRLIKIIKEELNGEVIMVPGYGRLLKHQVKRKLAEMLREAAEDALEGKYPHLDGGVIQALHKALKEN